MAIAMVIFVAALVWLGNKKHDGSSVDDTIDAILDADTTNLNIRNVPRDSAPRSIALTSAIMAGEEWLDIQNS